MILIKVDFREKELIALLQLKIMNDAAANDDEVETLQGRGGRRVAVTGPQSRRASVSQDLLLK